MSVRSVIINIFQLFKSVLWAMHVNRTRYLKCPKCEKKSWNKKVLSEGNEND